MRIISARLARLLADKQTSDTTMIDLIIESLRSGDFRATARHHGTTIAWRDASTAKAALLAVLNEACGSHRCGNGKFDMTHLQPNAEAKAIMTEAGLIQPEAAGPGAGEAVDWAVVGPKLAEAGRVLMQQFDAVDEFVMGGELTNKPFMMMREALALLPSA